MSLICCIVILIIGIFRMQEFRFGYEKFIQNVASKANEKEVEQIDLAALDYTLAIKKIDRNVGRLEAKQVSWPKDGDLTETAIDLVDCSELLPNPEGETDGYILNESFNPYL